MHVLLTEVLFINDIIYINEIQFLFIVSFSLVYLFIHSVPYVTLDRSITDYNLQHNL